MMSRRNLLPLVLLLSASANASHLSEEQVAAMEARCEDKRAELLAPKKLEVLDECLDAGEAVEECRDDAATEGEVRHIGTNYLAGEHYDLPECVEARRARKHYQVNPYARDSL